MQALRIQSPFALYLPPRLESLKTFSLDACKPHHTSEIHRIVLEKIPAFLVAQRSVIRNLSLMMNNPTFNMSPVLQSLRLISCLHDISLALPYVTMTTTLTITAVPFKGRRSILETHQYLRSFKDLSFTPNFSSDFHYEEWHSVELPNLKNLTIRVPMSGVSIGSFELGNFIQQFSSSLVSLTIRRLLICKFRPSKKKLRDAAQLSIFARPQPVHLIIRNSGPLRFCDHSSTSSFAFC